MVIIIAATIAAGAFWLGNALGRAGKESMREQNNTLKEKFDLANVKVDFMQTKLNAMSKDSESIGSQRQSKAK